MLATNRSVTGAAHFSPVTALLLALALAWIPDPAAAQAPPPSAPPPGTATGQPPTKQGFLKAYNFKPTLYWGAGLGVDILPAKDAVCPTGVSTCIGAPVGGGFEFHMGARFHYLIAADITYDAFFFPQKRNTYNRATLQNVRLDLRVYLLSGANLEVFLFGGGGIAFFGDEYKIDGTGGGFGAGAGLELRPSLGFSFDITAGYRGAIFNKIDTDFGTTETVAHDAFLHGVFIMMQLQFHYVFSK